MSTRIGRLVARRADVVSGVLVLIAWLVVAGTLHPLWLPTLPSVIEELWTLMSDGSLSFLATTGSTLLIGLVVTFAISAVVAVLMASSEVIEESLLPYVNGFLAIPHIALIPMFTFVWGTGELTRIVTTIAFTLSPVILTWTAALKNSPAELSEMASSFGAGPINRARYVRMPAAIAPIIAGLRIGVVQGIKGVVSAEVIIGVVGVGKLISTASATFNIAELYAVVVLIIAFSIVFYLLFTVIENRITQWNK